MRRLPDIFWDRLPGLGILLDLLEQESLSCVRFVGGCVRDTVRGYPVSDIDLAVRLSPGRLLSVLERGGVSFWRAGASHGVFSTWVGSHKVELASLRRDVRTDGRHAEIAATDCWSEDARRRDFRCNAVYSDRSGRLFDPVGGLADIGLNRVVFIGDAGARIREDYLRILRFFRFSALLSAELDSSGLRAISENLDGIGRLSAQRIREELFRLLWCQDAARVLRAMIERGVLSALFGEDVSWDLRSFLRMLETDREQGLEPDEWLRFLVLAPSLFKSREFAYKLQPSRSERRRLEVVLQDLPTGLDAGAELYRQGASIYRDRIRLAWAKGQEAGISGLSWRHLLAQSEGWVRPEFPVSGVDLRERGMEQGADLGRCLRKLEQEWIASGFLLSRRELLERVSSFG